MSELRSLLEDIGQRVAPAEDSWEQLSRMRRRRTTRRRMVAGALALAVAGIGTFTMYKAFDLEPRIKPVIQAAPSYYLVLPVEARIAGGPYTREVVARTNLPEGTRVGIEVSRLDVTTLWGASVRRGRIVVRFANHKCGGPSPEVSAFTVTLTVSVNNPQPLRGPMNLPPSPPPHQPWQVRSVLGQHFENLVGDQVTVGWGGKVLVTSRGYPVPDRLCLG